MSKELFENLREIEIQAQLSDELFMQIPSEIRQQMSIKRIDQPNFRQIYEQDKTWKQLHKDVIEAVKARSEREDEIRANYK
jgi:Glu-tRNA(Gln) amidotransferase subunit E-like FAD-binding protein